jgi:predicted small lipoprotein YifL
LSFGSGWRAARAQQRRGTLRAVLMAAFAAAAGCGQTGPLALPDSARPIDRLDPAGRPLDEAAQPDPGAATGTTPPAQRELDRENGDAEDDDSEGDGSASTNEGSR